MSNFALERTLLARRCEAGSASMFEVTSPRPRSAARACRHFFLVVRSDSVVRCPKTRTSHYSYPPTLTHSTLHAPTAIWSSHHKHINSVFTSIVFGSSEHRSAHVHSTGAHSAPRLSSLKKCTEERHSTAHHEISTALFVGVRSGALQEAVRIARYVKCHRLPHPWRPMGDGLGEGGQLRRRR